MEITKKDIRGNVLIIYADYKEKITEIYYLYKEQGKYELIGSSVSGNSVIENIADNAKTIIEQVFENKDRVKLLANGFLPSKELLFRKELFR